MEKITFTLPKTLREAIRKAAAHEGRDPSQFVRVTMADRLGISLPVKADRKKTSEVNQPLTRVSLRSTRRKKVA